VWTSATHHHFVFEHPGDKSHFNAILRRRDQLFRGLPDRSPNEQVLLRLNQLSRWYPRPIIWIALGLITLLFRRPHGIGTAAALALSALGIIVLNALGLFADPHFALPVAPAFVLFGCGALLGRR
jgi:hypothetical protein